MSDTISPATTYRAIWGDTVLAESDRTISLEGNAYFPPDDVRWEHLTSNPKTSVCSWKGTANYFDATDGDCALPAAAWTYQSPTSAAAQITRHVAFWNGVKVERVAG